ncbi:MAG: flagellar biosynthetic protein FliO [Spirochaetaceae bacterium]|nr:flagellar biosynthetic protein FliO [Spirochaetaceae bacterium]
MVIVFSLGRPAGVSAQDAGAPDNGLPRPVGESGPVGDGGAGEAGGGGASPEAGLSLDEEPEAAAFTGTGPSARSAVLRMVLVLALVAVFIYIAVFIMKRLLKGIARPQESSNPYLKVLATVHLGSNHFLHVVALGPAQAWLVGSGDGGVRLIAEIEDRETVDSLLLDASRNNAGAGKFADFRSIFRRLGGGKAEDPGLSPDNIRKRRERLRGL